MIVTITFPRLIESLAMYKAKSTKKKLTVGFSIGF